MSIISGSASLCGIKLINFLARWKWFWAFGIVKCFGFCRAIDNPLCSLAKENFKQCKLKIIFKFIMFCVKRNNFHLITESYDKKVQIIRYSTKVVSWF